MLDLASSMPTPSPTSSGSSGGGGEAPGFFDAGLGRFLVSPGLGGLAAFFGGALAFFAAILKSRDDRDKANRDRWWETLTWIYDRGTATDQARMPADMVIGLLEQLFDEADQEHTVLEIAAVEGLFGMFQTRQEAEQKKRNRRRLGRRG